MKLSLLSAVALFFVSQVQAQVTRTQSSTLVKAKDVQAVTCGTDFVDRGIVTIDYWLAEGQRELTLSLKLREVLTYDDKIANPKISKEVQEKSDLVLEQAVSRCIESATEQMIEISNTPDGYVDFSLVENNVTALRVMQSPTEKKAEFTLQDFEASIQARLQK